MIHLECFLLCSQCFLSVEPHQIANVFAEILLSSNNKWFKHKEEQRHFWVQSPWRFTLLLPGAITEDHQIWEYLIILRYKCYEDVVLTYTDREKSPAILWSFHWSVTEFITFIGCSHDDISQIYLSQVNRWKSFKNPHSPFQYLP